MTRKQGRKCPYGDKGCKQLVFYRYSSCILCCGYRKINKKVKVDKITLCMCKDGKRRDIYGLAPDEAIAIADILQCGVMYFLTHFKPYEKWRGW